MEMMENYLLYSVSVLLFFLKRQCVREKIRCIFHYFWNCLNPFLSSLYNHKNIRQKKAFIFCFCPVPFLMDFFFQHFSLFFTFITVVFVHFLLSSFCSSLLVFLSFFFPLFSPSFFHYLSVSSSSFFLNLTFPYLFFFHRRFCASSFGLTHFSSLFCSWSHSSFLPYFSSFPYPFFHVKPNT